MTGTVVKVNENRERFVKRPEAEVDLVKEKAEGEVSKGDKEC